MVHNYSKIILLLSMLLVPFVADTTRVLAEESSSVLYVPLIGITSVPVPAVLGEGGGKVTYRYAVRNFLAEVPFSDVEVHDDKCRSVEYVEGDDDGDSYLGFSETWKYLCTTTISDTTESVATVVGRVNNIRTSHQAHTTVVVGKSDPASVTITVATTTLTNVARFLSQPVPSLPETGISANEKLTLWAILLAVLVGLIAWFIYLRNRDANSRIRGAIPDTFPGMKKPTAVRGEREKKSWLVRALLPVVVFIVLATGAGVYTRESPALDSSYAGISVSHDTFDDPPSQTVQDYRSNEDNEVVGGGPQNTETDRLYGWKFPVTKFPLTGLNFGRLAYSDIRDPGGMPQGLPVRLKIPIIGVDTAIEDALITPDGRMDVPAGSVNVAWFALGPQPGEEGSAVIGGHFGMRDGVPFVFYDLDKLQIGDKIYVTDDKEDTHTFIVREIQLFDRTADATTVFTSLDGLAHLNLITCEGIWNEVDDTYPMRRVVFADLVNEGGALAPSTAIFHRTLAVGSLGEDVKLLQTFLWNKGFFTPTKNLELGYFGKVTSVALAKYQGSVGLPSVGIFDQPTRASLITELERNPHLAYADNAERINSSVDSPRVFLQSLRSLYLVKSDGRITLLLFLAIAIIATLLFRNFYVRKGTEKDLENITIATAGVLSDLEAEKRLRVRLKSQQRTKTKK